MEERNKEPRGAVSRRNFLALAGAGAAVAAVAGWPERKGLSKLLPAALGGESQTQVLDTGGIAM